MLMTTPKDLWIKNVIDSLKEFASSEFQEKGWVRGVVHDYCCYIETINGLFQEAVFDDFIDEKAKEFGFSSDQIEKLDRFRKAVQAFDTRYGGWEDPKDILNDPEWSKIRELAKEALISLGIEQYLDPSKAIPKKSLLNLFYYMSEPENVDRWVMREVRKGERNPFEEFMDDIFRMCKLEEIIAQYKDYDITEDQLKSLKLLRDALVAYRKKTLEIKDLREVLGDVEWQRIQALAGEVVKAFDYQP